jgi:hypothetical protein
MNLPERDGHPRQRPSLYARTERPTPESWQLPAGTAASAIPSRCKVREFPKNGPTFGLQKEQSFLRQSQKG